MIRFSEYRPRICPILGNVDSAEIDRAQTIDPTATLNRDKVEEIGRDGAVGYLYHSRYICEGFEKQENTFGENYPTFSQLLKINNLKNDRKTLVKKLLNKDNKRITKNEIIDMSIDLWKYNKRCRRQKI